MSFRFEPQKAVQAAAVLLGFEQDNRMSYLRLLKLLYIADREHLKKTGRPIIGNRPVAMKNGPLHSGVYDLIKSEHPAENIWSRHIRKNRYEVELVSDPGVLELSRTEVSALSEVSQRHSNDTEWDLIELTHTFEEWIANYVEGTSTAIPLEHILDAVGFSPSDRDAILNEWKESFEDSKVVPSHRLPVAP